MFGSELAYGYGTPQGKVWYRLFGHDLMGLRIRSLHFKKMINQLPYPRRILDAGSGEGCYSFYLASRFPQAQVVGVELDGDRIVNCNLILSKVAFPNLKFVQTDLLIYAPPAQFDLICCIDVMEHIVDDKAVLQNLRSALQPNGVLLLHVPRRHQMNRHHFQGVWNPGLKRQANHVRDEYTESEITHKLESTGFKIEERRYTFGWFGSLARELGFAVQNLNTVRPIVKSVVWPFLMEMAYLDTFTCNEKWHQGFFFRASPSRSFVDHRDEP